MRINLDATKSIQSITIIDYIKTGRTYTLNLCMVSVANIMPTTTTTTTTTTTSTTTSTTTPTSTTTTTTTTSTTTTTTTKAPCVCNTFVKPILCDAFNFISSNGTYDLNIAFSFYCTDLGIILFHFLSKILF